MYLPWSEGMFLSSGVNKKNKCPGCLSMESEEGNQVKYKTETLLEVSAQLPSIQ